MTTVGSLGGRWELPVVRSGAGAHPVEVGRGTLPTWLDRIRSAVALLGTVMVSGVLVALGIGVAALLVAVVVSAAIN